MEQDVNDEINEVNRLIERAEREGSLADEDLERVLRYVEISGFDPNARECVRGNVRHLFTTTTALPVDVHHARHVIVLHEWPEQTTAQKYVDTGREVICNLGSAVFTSRYSSTLQLGIIGWTPDSAKGIRAQELTLVEYRVEIAHWVTLYQPIDGIQGVVENPTRENVIWLRQLTARE